jgi:multidrug efflux pump subunit AcrA (membrane-fusion protein)
VTKNFTLAFEDEAQSVSRSDEPVRLTAELDTMPDWMRGAGLKSMIALALGIPSLAMLLPWNESVTVTLEITSEIAPAEISAPYTARVQNVMVSDGQRLAKNAAVLTLEDQMETGSMTALADYVRKVDLWLAGTGPQPIPFPVATGDDLQQRYSDLVGAIEQLQVGLSHSSDIGRRQSLINQIKLLESNARNTVERRALAERSAALARDKLNARAELAKRGWISANALLDFQSDVVRADMEKEQIAVEYGSIRRSIEALSGELKGLKEERSVEHDQLRGKVKQNLASLKGEMENRFAQRVLNSPAVGRIMFSSRIAPGMTVQKGQELGVISPGVGPLIGYGAVAFSARGAVASKQAVYLEFHNYSAAKYGYVVGRVSNVADVARNSGYQIRVEFPNGLRTERGFELPHKERMAGRARIVTNEGRVWERIFGNVRNVTGL